MHNPGAGPVVEAMLEILDVGTRFRIWKICMDIMM